MNKAFITTTKTGVIIPAEGLAPMLFMEWCSDRVNMSYKKPSIKKVYAGFEVLSFRLPDNLTGADRCGTPAFLIEFNGAMEHAVNGLLVSLSLYINQNL